MTTRPDPAVCHHDPRYTPDRGVWCRRCGVKFVVAGEVEKLKELVVGQAERIAAQSELLSKRAEG